MTAFHPFAAIFPMLSRPRLEELAEDISSNGLLQDIVLYQEQIIDGRNRYMACDLARVEPRYVRLEDLSPEVDPLQWVMSLNLKRRHLTTSQRAMAAERFEELWTARSRTRQQEAAKKTNELRWGENADNADDHDQLSLVIKKTQATTRAPLARENAGEQFNVSGSSVYQARVVRRDGVDGLANAVEQGRSAVTTAARIARLPRADQEHITRAIEAAPTDKEARSVARQQLRAHTAPPPPPPVDPVVPIRDRPDRGDIYLNRNLAEALLDILDAIGAMMSPVEVEARDLLRATLDCNPIPTPDN